MPVFYNPFQPDNIFLTSDSTKVKLGDFGMARRVDLEEEENTHTGSAGTKLYMAPEQVNSFYKSLVYNSCMCATHTFFQL